MATYAIARVIRGSLEFQLVNGQSAFVVLHFGVTGVDPVDQGNVNVVTDELFELATQTYSTFHLYDFMSDQVTIVAGHARTVDPLNPLAADIAIGQAGAHPSEPLPPESAIVATHYSALASRRGRGRSFLPGWSVEAIVDGLVPASLVTILNNIWSGWRTAMSADIEFAVWSPTNGTAQSVTSSVTRSVFHHQSSRNP
jgi:hypothetical protein